MESESTTSGPVPAETRTTWSFWGAWLYRLAVASGVLLLLFGAWVAYVAIRPEYWLAEEVARVRERGDPLTAEEMEARFGPTAEQRRLGEELLPLLQASGDPERSARKYDDIPWPAPPDAPDPRLVAHPLPPDSFYAGRQEVLRELLARREQFPKARIAADFAKLGLYVEDDGEAERKYGPLDGLGSLLAHSRRSLAKGNVEEAVTAFEAAIELRHLIACVPTEMGHLLRQAFVVKPCIAVPRFISSPHIREEHLLRLRKALRAIEDRDEMAEVNVAHVSSHYATIEQIRAKRARGEFGWLEERLMLWTMIECLSLQSDARDCFTPPRTDGLARFQALISQAEGHWSFPIPSSRSDAAAILDMQPFAYHLRRERMALRAAADVALTAEIYRQKTGIWPSTPDDLRSYYPEGFPVDPMAPGHPIRLRANEAGLRVYSVGPDEEDGLGQWRDDNRYPDIVIFLPHIKQSEEIAPEDGEQ